MKHFYAIVYMVFCVFVVKAQQKEPLIYGMSSNLIEFNYRTNEEKLITKFGDTRGNSAFDAFNGRYFFLTACIWQNCPFNSSGVIIEINVKSGEKKYHPFDFSLMGFQYIFDYDPISLTILSLLKITKYIAIILKVNYWKI